MKRRLPRLTGREVIRALRRGGFVETRVRGSHHFLIHEQDPTRRATVAVHGSKILPIGTLSAILQTAKVTPQELEALR